MKKQGKAIIYNLWQKAGGKESGNWPQVFGDEAGELQGRFTAGQPISRQWPKSGKQFMIYRCLLTCGWIRWSGGLYRVNAIRPGCPIPKVLDIYKWFTPHIDIIAPDNPHTNIRMRSEVNAKYARDDNQLFIVEAPGTGIFHDIADFNAVGYFLHFDHTPDGTPKNMRIVNMLKSVAAAIPLLLKYQGTGKIHAVEEEEGMQHHGLGGMQMDFDGYMGLIEFGGRARQSGTGPRAGLIIQTAKNEFYMVGINFRLLLRKKTGDCSITCW